MPTRSRIRVLLAPIVLAALMLAGWDRIAETAYAQTGGEILIAVDAGEPGIPIHRELLGQFIPNPRLDVFDPDSRQGGAAGVATYLRGLYGAFYADYYDWRDPLGLNDPLRSGSVPGVEEISDQIGTLDYLRLAAANGAAVTLNVNTRGVREVFTYPHVGEVRWVMTDTATLAGWAADWVHYVNYTVQRFDVDNPPDAAASDFFERRSAEILEAIDWRNRNSVRGRPELPQPGEALPLVTYWEIGNEPNFPLSGFQLEPEEFAARYLAITTAMIERDVLINGVRTIRVGPSLTATYPPLRLSIRDYVDALEAAGAVVDFVAYHPYTTIYGDWVNSDGVIQYGLTPAMAAEFAPKDFDLLRRTLSGIYEFQETLFISTTFDAPAGVELIANEWNPSSWEAANADVWKAKSMGQALGVVETLFNFARLEMRAAVYFSDPAFREIDRPFPLLETFAFLERALGDELLAAYAGEASGETPYRAYVTRHGDGSSTSMPGAIVLWGLNWGTEPVRFDFELAGLMRAYQVGQRCELAGRSLLEGALGGSGALPPVIPIEVECRSFGAAAVSTLNNRLAVTVEVPPNAWVAVVVWPSGRPGWIAVDLGPWGAWRPELLTVGSGRV